MMWPICRQLTASSCGLSSPNISQPVVCTSVTQCHLKHKWALAATWLEWDLTKQIKQLQSASDISANDSA